MSDQMQIFFFFFNDTATTEIYTLSLHDALPILQKLASETGDGSSTHPVRALVMAEPPSIDANEITDKGYINQRAVLERSEEHTSELQPPDHLVCRLLLEKKTISCAYTTGSSLSS